MIMKRLARVLRVIPAAALCCAISATGMLGAAAEQTNLVDKLKNLEFREIGPATMGGRIDDFAVVESNPNIVYVGTASGGVWKTTNNGTTWEPIFDREEIGRASCRERV